MSELKKWILPVVVCAFGVASVIEWNTAGNSWVDTWFHEMGHVFGDFLGVGFGWFTIGPNYSGSAYGYSILPWWGHAGAYSFPLIVAYFLIRKYSFRGLIALPFMLIMAQKNIYYNFVTMYNVGDIADVPGGVAGLVVIGIIQIAEFVFIMEFIIYRRRKAQAKKAAELAAIAKRKSVARALAGTKARSSVNPIPSRPVPQVGRTAPRTLVSTRYP
jgi:hypothetical protein